LCFYPCSFSICNYCNLYDGGWVLTESTTLFYQPLHLASHKIWYLMIIIVHCFDANKPACLLASLPLSTSVYIDQLCLIWQKYVFLLLPALDIISSFASHGGLPWVRMSIYGQQDNIVMLSPGLPPGMICHWLTLHVSLTTLGQFQHKLKTVLLCLAYETWSGALVTV